MALSKKKKQKLAQQARNEVNRETAGAGASAKAAIGQANRDYGRNVRDARGANRVMVSNLGNMLSNLGNANGLSARDRSMLARDLRSRIAESTSGLPFAIQEANQARTDAIADARADLASVRADRQAAVGKRFNDLLEEARDAKADRIEARQEKAATGGLERGVKNALIAGRVSWGILSKQNKRAYLQNPEKWAADLADATEGVDNVDAKKAVAILFKRMKNERQESIKSTFEGLYGPQDWSKKPKKRAR